MVHRLAAENPGVFRAVAPIYGLPLAGQLKVPSALGSVSIMQLHDRWDTTIPIAGGLSSQGWLYTSLGDTLKAWAMAGQVNASAALAPAPTPWDGGEQYLACAEFPGGGSRKVMQCLFDGYHGSWLPGDTGEQLTWWFFGQFV